MTDLSAHAPETRALAAMRLARAWWPIEAAEAVRLGLTSIAAMSLCMLFLLDTPEWAGWTVISVALANRAMSLQKSLWRALGSMIGAAVAIAMIDAFAQDTLAFDVALALWLAFVTFMSTLQRGFRTYGFALMGYTVPIVTLGQVQHPERVFDVAVDRCATTLVGLACAYASATLAAKGVRTVRRELAGRLDAATHTCRGWVRASCDGDLASRPPIGDVLALDTAIFDGFVEQPSLRTGGRVIRDAPIVLLHLLTVGMLRARLPEAERDAARALLDARFVGDKGDWDQLETARRQLLDLRRPDMRRVPAKPLPLDLDMIQAAKNALRAVIAVSATNAFWYVSNWPPGGGMVTWAALVCVLYATVPDGGIPMNFLVGAVMAAVVGIVAQYLVLAQSFSYIQLVTVLLPLTMLAAIGHGEKRATYGAGFSFLVLTALGPQNVMTYDFAASLNAVLANVLGLGTAVVCFTYVLPPATPETRAERARRRMVRDVRMLGRRPALLLPSRNVWLARMYQRLDRVSAEARFVGGGEILVVAGALLFAVRRADDRLGRDAVRAAWAAPSADGDPLARLAEDASPLQRRRLETVGRLLRAAALEHWRGVPTARSA